MDDQTDTLVREAVKETLGELSLNLPGDVVDKLTGGITARLRVNGMAPEPDDDFVTIEWAGQSQRVQVIDGPPDPEAGQAVETVAIHCRTRRGAEIWVLPDQVAEQGKLVRILDRVTQGP